MNNKSYKNHKNTKNHMFVTIHVIKIYNFRDFFICILYVVNLTVF